MAKKYRVRLVIDDILEADNPKQAKHDFRELIWDGWYGSRAYIEHNFIRARRRKDLEGGN